MPYKTPAYQQPMSVYTPIYHQQLQEFLEQYSLGSLVQFSGIQAGIENTNYRVSTSQGEFILTLFESLTAQQLPPYLQLLNHLKQANFPAPKPHACGKDICINTLANKPAVVFNCLAGQAIATPSIGQCMEIGQYLAKLHLVSSSSDFYKRNSKNLKGCQQLFNTIKPHLCRQGIDLLHSELNFQGNYPLPVLPQGIIHADLFRDNVLFNQGHISGILDFYNACNDYFLFDIAVTCNDWCAEHGSVNQQKIKALLSGYQSIRMLSEDEKLHLTVFFRLAALRFWLSRLEHQLNPKEGGLTLEKDPLVFRRLLEYYRTKSCA